MKKKITLAGILGFMAPALVLAQGTDAINILSVIQSILNILIPILITLGVVYFIWGVIQYVTAADEEKKTKARSTMISGIIGLFVIISIWGLVYLIQNTFDIRSDGINGNVPCIPNPQLGVNC